MAEEEANKWKYSGPEITSMAAWLREESAKEERKHHSQDDGGAEGKIVKTTKESTASASGSRTLLQADTKRTSSASRRISVTDSKKEENSAASSRRRRPSIADVMKKLSVDNSTGGLSLADMWGELPDMQKEPSDACSRRKLSVDMKGLSVDVSPRMRLSVADVKKEGSDTSSRRRKLSVVEMSGVNTMRLSAIDMKDSQSDTITSRRREMSIAGIGDNSQRRFSLKNPPSDASSTRKLSAVDIQKLPSEASPRRRSSVADIQKKEQSRKKSSKTKTSSPHKASPRAMTERSPKLTPASVPKHNKKSVPSASKRKEEVKKNKNTTTDISSSTKKGHKNFPIREELIFEGTLCRALKKLEDERLTLERTAVGIAFAEGIANLKREEEEVHEYFKLQEEKELARVRIEREYYEGLAREERRMKRRERQYEEMIARCQMEGLTLNQSSDEESDNFEANDDEEEEGARVGTDRRSFTTIAEEDAVDGKCASSSSALGEIISATPATDDGQTTATVDSREVITSSDTEGETATTTTATSLTEEDCSSDSNTGSHNKQDPKNTEKNIIYAQRPTNPKMGPMRNHPFARHITISLFYLQAEHKLKAKNLTGEALAKAKADLERHERDICQYYDEKAEKRVEGAVMVREALRSYEKFYGRMEKQERAKKKRLSVV